MPSRPSTAPSTRVPAAASGRDERPDTSRPVIASDGDRMRSVVPALALTALRVLSAIVLMQHGFQKFMGVPATAGRPFGGPPEAFSRSWIAGVLELVGGALLVLGLFTRPVAFVLSGLMAAAYFLVHAPDSFYPVINRGEPAVLLCFIFLYFAAVGGGPFSVDALLQRRGGQSTR